MMPTNNNSTGLVLTPALELGGSDSKIKKDQKGVSFASNVSSVVAYIEKRGEMEYEDLLWYSEDDRTEMRNGTLEYAKELQEKYPSLVKGMECIYAWADLRSREEQEQEAEPEPACSITAINKQKQKKHDFLDKWASLNSDRRGLEKKIVRKEFQARRLQSVEGSRKVVLTLQDMFAKAPSDDGSQEEIIRRQYQELSRPYKIFAQTLALTDEEVVKSYHSSESKPKVKKSSSSRSLPTLLDSEDDSDASITPARSSKSRRNKMKKAASMRCLLTSNDSAEGDLTIDSTHSKQRRSKSKSPMKERKSTSPKKKRSLSPKKAATNEDPLAQNIVVVAPAC